MHSEGCQNRTRSKRGDVQEVLLVRSSYKLERVSKYLILIIYLYSKKKFRVLSFVRVLPAPSYKRDTGSCQPPREITAAENTLLMPIEFTVLTTREKSLTARRVGTWALP